MKSQASARFTATARNGKANRVYAYLTSTNQLAVTVWNNDNKELFSGIVSFSNSTPKERQMITSWLNILDKGQA